MSFVKFGQVPHLKYLEEIFVRRLDVQLIFKNVTGNQKVYTECKYEKIPETDSAPPNRTEWSFFLKLLPI